MKEKLLKLKQDEKKRLEENKINDKKNEEDFFKIIPYIILGLILLIILKYLFF